MQGCCCCFHIIFPATLVASPQKFHPSSQYSHIQKHGSWYPCWWMRYWYKFHLAAWWGRHSLPCVGIDLGIMGKSRCHCYLIGLHHIQWIFPRHCIQYWIQLYCMWNQSEIYNWSQFFLLVFNRVVWIYFELTLSTLGPGWIGWEQESHCHWKWQ